MSERPPVTRRQYNKAVDRLAAAYADKIPDLEDLKDSYQGGSSLTAYRIRKIANATADTLDQWAQNRTAKAEYKKEYTLAEAMSQDIQDDQAEADDSDAESIAIAQGRERRDIKAARQEKIRRGIGRVGIWMDSIGNGIAAFGNKVGDKINGVTETLSSTPNDTDKLSTRQRIRLSGSTASDSQPISSPRRHRETQDVQDAPREDAEVKDLRESSKDKHPAKHRGGGDKYIGKHRTPETQRVSRVRSKLGRLAVGFHNRRAAFSSARDSYAETLAAHEEQNKL